MSEVAKVQETYTTILKHFIHTGRAPHYTELSHILGVNPDEAKALLCKASEATIGCWLIRDTDYIESWAPFYNAATNYGITVDQKQKWFGQ